MTETKAETKPAETKPAVEQFAHKNPPVGPATGRPVADWRKDRDYEQFMPTPTM